MIASVRDDLPTGTVTFLFTDVEGSTRLLHKLGAEAYAEALAEHRRIIREACAAQGGVEVDTQGDAFFVAFPTAPGALAAAAALTDSLAPGPIHVRVGLHTGAPLVTDEGYVGDDVHRAARIAAVGHGGQVLVAASTAALVGSDGLVDLGQHRFKDLPAPERVYQCGDAAFPPLKSLYRSNLPLAANPLVGRKKELADVLQAILDGGSAVTITGPGGVGKTRFALAVAGEAAHAFPDGVWFVPLASLRDPRLVLPTVADAIGADGDVARHIGDGACLLFLDNFEQIVEAAPVLATLAGECPRLRLLVTSREALRIAVEREYPLPPLPESPSVELLRQRASAVAPDIEVAYPTAVEICDRLDRLPLAIELAAARCKALSPEQILERLSEKLDLLRGGRDADERHATLRTTIAWSYDLLDADEQRLFARLAVFRSGCTLEAAEAVCDSNLDTLASLVDKNLVRRRSDANGEERYWMLETIREFAREHLAASDEEDALRRHQADWLIALADRAGTRATVGVPGEWDLDLVAPEIDNVRAVLDWAVEHDPERGLALAASLEGFWLVREQAEGASRLEPLLARAPDAEPELRAHALRALGGAYQLSGDSERAAPYYQRSLDLFIASGDEVQTANLRYRVAGNMVDMGETAAAWPLLEEILRTFRQLDLPRGEAQVLGYLAEKPRAEGDLARAIELMLESAAIAHEIGWAWWESGQLRGAAELERTLGKLDAAEGHALRSLELSLALGNRRGALITAAELAVIAAKRGDAERAGRLWGAIECEQTSRPVRQWENRREEFEALVVGADGPKFASARAEGRLLSIAEAADAESAPAVSGSTR